MNHETVTKIDIKRRNDMIFPQITICYGPETHIYKSYFQEHFIKLEEVTYRLNFGPWSCDFINSGRNISGHRVTLLTTRVIGKNNGLKLALYIPKSSIPTYFIVNHNNELTTMKDIISLKAHPGVHNDLVLTKEIDENLGEPFNKCHHDLNTKATLDSIPFQNIRKSGFNYRYVNCYEACFCMYLATEFNCTCPHLYETNHSEFCYLKNLFRRKEINFDHEKMCDKHCPRECNFNYIKPTITKYRSDSLPFNLDETAFQSYFQSKESKPEYDLDQISSLYFYFNDLREYDFIEKEKFGIIDMVASIGGCLGLFLGLSLFSLIEIVEVIGELFYLTVKFFKK